MAKETETDESLKRLGGGRWQTRDERFTIEPQSGTWVVVDAEQTDDLGLALVRGPFGSLGAAKEAIAAAREAEPAASPLAAKLADARDRPRAATAKASDRGRTGSKAVKAAKPGASAPAPAPEPPAEPRWIQALEPAARRRAKRLIDRLAEAGAFDPEGMVRRDIVGAVPATAAFAVVRALAALAKDASPVEVARLLLDGRDPDLGVRWRLVDGDDRPITIDFDAVKPR
ncbi:MAG: hypothetical protein ABJC39_10105 [Chloroflexota bacterium]